MVRLLEYCVPYGSFPTWQDTLQLLNKDLSRSKQADGQKGSKCGPRYISPTHQENSINQAFHNLEYSEKFTTKHDTIEDTDVYSTPLCSDITRWYSYDQTGVYNQKKDPHPQLRQATPSVQKNHLTPKVPQVCSVTVQYADAKNTLGRGR